MFIRAKQRGNKTYYYLVEGKREGSKVRQKVIKYLGTVEPSPEALQRIINEVKREGRSLLQSQHRQPGA